MSVKLVSVQGPVRVSAPATAHQAGRLGDEISVTNQITKKQLRARVIDAQTVEVLR
jgi:flagella basal body P-ring formation protein FlgA